MVSPMPGPGAGFVVTKEVAVACVVVESLLVSRSSMVSSRLVDRATPSLSPISEYTSLASSAYVFADDKGGFSLKDVPEGEHTLHVLYRGKLYFTKKIQVGRSPVEAGTLTIDRAP